MRLIYVLIFILYPTLSLAEILVSEDFNTENYTSPLSIYYYDEYDAGIVYSATPAYGGSGFAVEAKHIDGTLVMAKIDNLQNYLDGGVYFRYYVFYPASYYWPGEEELFDNVKMFKIAGSVGWDVEFIYKNTSGGDGPTALQLYWNRESTGVANGGTGTGSTTLGGALSKDEWHKIEIYIKIPDVGLSELHVQVDDYDVYECADCDIRKDDSQYIGTQQFMSIRASNSPTAGHETWYFDSITVVAGEGDLCDNEPEEISSNRKSIATGVPGGSRLIGVSGGRPWIQ